MLKFIFRGMLSLMVYLYRTTGGRIVGKVQGLPVLLLTTTGRKSGKLRTVPLGYLRDGSTYVITASYGGLPRHPAWFFNLESHPEAIMQVKKVQMQVKAEVDDTDLEHGWKRYFAGWARRQPSARETVPKMRQMWPGYVQRAIIRVQPTRFLGWPEGDMQRAPEIVEVHGATIESQSRTPLSRLPLRGQVSASITLLRYDQQRANEAYLLFYGQLARRDDTWLFTPTRVVHRSLERREQTTPN